MGRVSSLIRLLARGRELMELARRDGLCEVKVAGVRNRYMPLQKLPRTAAKMDEIADAMFDSMVSREEADVARLYGVCEVVRTAECESMRLAGVDESAR